MQFLHVIDQPELAIEPEDENQPITDSEDKIVRKELECAAKKKIQRDILCVPVRQALNSGFTAPSLSDLTLLSCFLMPTKSSYPGLPTLLLSCLFIPTLLFCPRSPTLLLSCLSIPALLFYPLVPASSSPLMSILLTFPMLALSSFLVPILVSFSMLGLVAT